MRSSIGSPTSGRGYPYSPNQVGNEVSAVYDTRPGSAPTVVMQRFRPNPNFPATMSGSYSSRASSALRRGTNAATVAASSSYNTAPPMSSYSLWTPRDQLTSETVTGTLALEIEVLKEKLQRQTDVAARAEAALNQLAMSSKVRAFPISVLLPNFKSPFAYTSAIENPSKCPQNVLKISADGSLGSRESVGGRQVSTLGGPRRKD